MLKTTIIAEEDSTFFGGPFILDLAVQLEEAKDDAEAEAIVRESLTANQLPPERFDVVPSRPELVSNWRYYATSVKLCIRINSF